MASAPGSRPVGDDADADRDYSTPLTELGHRGYERIVQRLQIEQPPYRATSVSSNLRIEQPPYVIAAGDEHPSRSPSTRDAVSSRRRVHTARQVGAREIRILSRRRA